MKKMMKVATFVAMVLAAGFISCQEKIPGYLIVDGTTLTGYTDGVPANLVIPKGITKIAGGAFVGCNRLESVTIPGSVKTIGEDITLEEAEEKGMDEDDLPVFYNCGSLRNVTIEKGVKTIGLFAFGGCASLTSVTIPNSVTAIGLFAFWECKSLASVTIPSSVTAIGDFAFGGCASLTSVTIPNSVTAIGENAFGGCKSLTSVTISNGVTEIGEYAFRSCASLTSVTIPKSVSKIEQNAFYDCENIVVTYEGSLKDWCAADRDSFPSEVKRVILSDGTDLKKLTKITANDLAGVTKIGKDAFYYRCTSLESVEIPKSVKEISNGAFYGCDNIAVVTYKGSLKDWCAVDWDFFLLRNAKLIALSDGTDPRKLTKITANDLTGVTRIGQNAFYGCKSLTSVTIPNSVTEIGEEAFRDCTVLTDVTILGSMMSIGQNAFYGCTGLTSVTIGNGVTSIGGNAFSTCTSLTSVEIPDSVTEIGWTAFCACTSLTSVTIPNSVTSIGRRAFRDCTSLKTVQYGGTKAEWEKIQGISESGLANKNIVFAK